jgi:hypothetical protein
MNIRRLSWSWGCRLAPVSFFSYPVQQSTTIVESQPILSYPVQQRTTVEYPTIVVTQPASLVQALSIICAGHNAFRRAVRSLLHAFTALCLSSSPFPAIDAFLLTLFLSLLPARPFAVAKA